MSGLNDHGIATNGNAPHSLEAETEVLGAILLVEAIPGDVTAAGLVAGDFYAHRYGLMFAAATALHDRGDAVTTIALAAELDRRGHLDAVGGRAPIAALVGPVSVSGVGTHARLVREVAHQRAIRDLALRVYDRPGDREAIRLLAARGDSPAGDDGTTSWTPVDFSSALDGTAADAAPTVLARSDGVALMYPGRRHLVMGEPEACKGWMMLAASTQILAEGGRVLYVDFEDSVTSVVGRLLALGVNPDAIRDRLLYVRPDAAVTSRDRDRILELAPTIQLAVLDGVTEAMVLHGLDLNSNTDVATWAERLPKPLARAGVPVVEIDHVVKDKEARGRYAIGAQHKLAGVDVAYSLEVVEPFGRGRDGKVKVVIKKDRPGHVRGHADDRDIAAFIHLTSSPSGGVSVSLSAPDSEQPAAAFRPTGLMEKMSKVLEDEPGMTRNELRASVGGRAKYVDLARQILVTEGYVEVRQDGQAHRHHTTRIYRETDDRVPGSQPGPNRVPDPVRGTGSPGPSPYRGDPVPDPVPDAGGPGNRVPVTTDLVVTPDETQPTPLEEEVHEATDDENDEADRLPGSSRDLVATGRQGLRGSPYDVDDVEAA